LRPRRDRVRVARAIVLGSALAMMVAARLLLAAALLPTLSVASQPNLVFILVVRACTAGCRHLLLLPGCCCCALRARNESPLPCCLPCRADYQLPG
jgi:hypothetical protein